MEREIVGKRPTFHQNRSGSNFYRILLWLSLIIAGIWVLRSLQRGEVISPFQPTPTPTRMAESFILEAQAYFNAGKLDDPSNKITSTPGASETGVIAQAEMAGAEATPVTPTPVPVINDAIEAYQAALRLDPNNALAWAELARIQAYSSTMLRNDAERLDRLAEALESAKKATEQAPDESWSHAIYSFVLDWYATNPLIPGNTGEELLAEANSEAVRAYNLDPENALALAYYAEILVDQQRWEQAKQYAMEAVRRDPNLMDTHRVMGYVHESRGEYNSAIQSYQSAVSINPNMTFLYVRIGRLFREGIKNADRALEYFDRAAKINQQLGVQNPIPYMEIARTYTQEGQFLIASVNAEKALSMDNANAHTYGQLGMIYRRARNYEGANPLLKCAVTGCTAEENELGKVPVQGLPLSGQTVAYYYVEYGTNLAFLSRENENFCSPYRDEFGDHPGAMSILRQVREVAGQWNDPFLVAIAEDSEGICRRLQGNTAPQPAATPQPDSTPDM